MHDFTQEDIDTITTQFDEGKSYNEIVKLSGKDKGFIAALLASYRHNRRRESGERKKYKLTIIDTEEGFYISDRHKIMVTSRDEKGGQYTWFTRRNLQPGETCVISATDDGDDTLLNVRFLDRKKRPEVRTFLEYKEERMEEEAIAEQEKNEREWNGWANYERIDRWRTHFLDWGDWVLDAVKEDILNLRINTRNIEHVSIPQPRRARLITWWPRADAQAISMKVVKYADTIIRHVNTDYWPLELVERADYNRVSSNTLAGMMIRHLEDPKMFTLTCVAAFLHDCCYRQEVQRLNRLEYRLYLNMYEFCRKMFAFKGGYPWNHTATNIYPGYLDKHDGDRLNVIPETEEDLMLWIRLVLHATLAQYRLIQITVGLPEAA